MGVHCGYIGLTPNKTVVGKDSVGIVVLLVLLKIKITLVIPSCPTFLHFFNSQWHTDDFIGLML